MKLKACIKSCRLRTLPQSLAGIVAGIGLASTVCRPAPLTVVFLILTAVFLQIVSNLSNELGDAIKGTDSAEKRQGMHYSIMDGEMTPREMVGLIGVMVALACVCGLVMIWSSFFREGMYGAVAAFIVLGAFTIMAAMRYTLGKDPYGYRGLGDFYVFVFFGLVATLGAAYIVSHRFDAIWILPASAIGLFGSAVLNVNNIRDMKTDMNTRNTVALRLGLKGARLYQTALLVLGWALLLAFTAHMSPVGFMPWAYCLTAPLYGLHLYGVWTRTERALDPMLPLLVVTNFLTALLFAFGL